MAAGSGSSGACKNGRNVLTARRKNGSGARLVIRNHPNGGPVFSGPQLQPWECQEKAVDKQCNQPPEYTFLYKPEDSEELAAYDRDNPPDDVATTTTDEGVEVPFIVRQELGYQDRDQYRILTLFEPGKKWTPLEAPGAVEPQAADHPRRRLRRRLRHERRQARRLQRHHPADPGLLPELRHGARPRVRRRATALNNNGHNCNLVRPGRVDADDEGAPGRAVRRPALHDRHRLLGRLDHPAAGGERVSGRRLRRPRRDVRVPRQPFDRRAVRRLPPAAHLLRGHLALGAGRRLDAVAVGRGRGPTRPRQRDRRRRAVLQGRDEPRRRLRAGRGRLQPRDEPGRRALLGARLHDQRARPAAGERVDGRREGGRPRLRGFAVRQRGHPVRARRAAPGADHAGPVPRPEREDRRLRHRRRAGPGAARR